MTNSQPIERSAEDEAAVRMILDAQAAAWNTGDATAWGVPYSDHADFVNILGQVTQGRAAMIDRHARIFAGPFKGSQVVITIRRFAKVSRDVAVIDTIHEVTGFQFLPSGIAATTHGKLITMMKYVAAKQGQSWEFVAAQNTASVPAVGG